MRDYTIYNHFLIETEFGDVEMTKIDENTFKIVNTQKQTIYMKKDEFIDNIRVLDEFYNGLKIHF